MISPLDRCICGIACVLPLLLGGCSSSDARPEWTVDTLASGRIVVRNAPDPNQQSPQWRLERVSRIGDEQNDAATFGRVCDVALSADGLIHVLDCLALEVRVFDTDGQHLRTIGREGDGPGEFRAPFALAFDPAGRLWVAEEGVRRYTVFDTAGRPLTVLRRPIRWPATSGALRFSRDGTLHEYGWWSNGPGGVIRIAVDSIAVVRDTVPLPPFDVHSFPHRGRPTMRWAVPFSPRHSVAPGPDGEVWTGVGTTYTYALISPAADTLRVVEFTAAAEPLSPADREAAMDTIAEADGQGFAADSRLVPNTHPYFTSMVVSETGEVWVRRPARSPEPAGQTTAVYDIFDSSGRYLSSVPTSLVDDPAPHITAEFIVGVVRDALDREAIEVYRIVRQPNTRAWMGSELDREASNRS